MDQYALRQKDKVTPLPPHHRVAVFFLPLAILLWVAEFRSNHALFSPERFQGDNVHLPGPPAPSKTPKDPEKDSKSWGPVGGC